MQAECSCCAIEYQAMSSISPCPTLIAGGPAFSLPAVLARQPPHVPALRFMNFEGQPEAGDLTNRIEQVRAWGRCKGVQVCMSLM